jgi:hypothetical protein
MNNGENIMTIGRVVTAIGEDRKLKFTFAGIIVCGMMLAALIVAVSTLFY